jgi:hypothetical protein
MSDIYAYINEATTTSSNVRRAVRNTKAHRSISLHNDVCSTHRLHVSIDAHRQQVNRNCMMFLHEKEKNEMAKDLNTRTFTYLHASISSSDYQSLISNACACQCSRSSIELNMPLSL